MYVMLLISLLLSNDLFHQSLTDLCFFALNFVSYFAVGVRSGEGAGGERGAREEANGSATDTGPVE